MNNLSGEHNERNSYVINHIPPIFSTNEFGSYLFGEDPGTIIDEILHDDQIEKLTR